MAARPPARERAATGTTAGFVLRIARESANTTQAGIAETMGVNLDTWQGWETGRRPISHMKAGALLNLRRRLLAQGSAPHALRLLDPAMDADRITSATIHGDPTTRHPLADWVHTRDTAHMLAWALNGRVPPALAHGPAPARRGPAAKAPVLPAPDRSVFFSQLRITAERALHAGQDGRLLHRQALYLCSYDTEPQATSWMAHALHARRDLIAVRGWNPYWATARSTAAALARLGDHQPLLDFIERGIVDDDAAETANLNYWAYWLGSTPEPQPDDGFMRRGQMKWEPVHLFRGLALGLHEAPAYVDLYAHSLWALLTTHRWLPMADAKLADELNARTAQLLDQDRISARSRHELSTVHYVLRGNRT